MPYKDLEKRKAYMKAYGLKYYPRTGYHANSGSFKKGHKLSVNTKLKISLFNKGKVLSPETRLKISNSRKGIVFSQETKEKLRTVNLGKKATFETKEKMRQAKIGLKRPNWSYKGEKHWNWIADRTKLAKRQERNDSAYSDWRKRVWLRDNFKCRIANQDCNGRIEAHHILPWHSYIELRYIINNGITLCHAHHPRTRALEQELAPVFQELLRKD